MSVEEYDEFESYQFAEGVSIAARDEADLRASFYEPFQLRRAAMILDDEWPNCPVVRGYARGLRVIAGQLEDEAVEGEYKPHYTSVNLLPKEEK